MDYIIIEQTRDYTKRIAYDPKTNTFNELEHDCLFLHRGFTHPYGWLKGSGTPPDEHLDVFLLIVVVAATSLFLLLSWLCLLFRFRCLFTGLAGFFIVGTISGNEVGVLFRRHTLVDRLANPCPDFSNLTTARDHCKRIVGSIKIFC